MSRDSRGLNRALQGDYPGTIADFQFYITWARDHAVDHPEAVDAIPSREAWIEALHAGRNPFTPDVLAALRDGNVVSPEASATAEAADPVE